MLTQKLACVPQTMLIELMVCENLLYLETKQIRPQSNALVRTCVSREASLDDRGSAVVDDCFPQK